jgi:predicted AAA+ superfamily ATPase
MLQNSQMIRVQKDIIVKDLEKKIVLLVGPRQCGKTWLAKDIARSFQKSLYLNYDQINDRKIIQDQSWLPSTDLLIFDELHKMPNWKNYLKGVFDTKPGNQRILVTGSARLDIYDKLGDSLAGRYFRHCLLPLSLAELKQASESRSMEKILERGGFPEPYFANNDIDALRWRAQYINSLLSTDIFEIETIHNLKGMRLVFDLLRSRVGSPVSYLSLARDVGVSPTTIKKYIQILESLYVIFSVPPYTRNVARSILKEPKIYFFDTALVEGKGGEKLENLVAVSLLKSLTARTDNLAHDCRLYYLRTKEGLEVDFAVTNHNEIEQIIEVKTSESSTSKSLRMFHEKYQYPAVQIVQSLPHEYQDKGINILKAENFLTDLYL